MTRDDDIRRTAAELARPLAEAGGVGLWGVEWASSGRGGVLRVYLDGEDGVTIDQCAKVSRHLGLALEVEDIIPGSWTLEVSSPGLERPFFRAGQLAAYLGREIAVEMARPLGEPFAGRKRFTGLLGHVRDHMLGFTVDGTEVEVDWNDVRKARLVHRFEEPKGGGPKRPAK